MAQVVDTRERVGEIEMSPRSGNNNNTRRRFYIYMDDEYAPNQQYHHHPPLQEEEEGIQITDTKEPIVKETKKIANPAPVGLLGFGMTTILLNVHNTGYYPLTTAIVGMGLCYGGIAQFIAGLLEYARGNTFAYVAFVSYGSFWLSLCVAWMAPNKSRVEGLTVSHTDAYFLGVYLLVWGIFTFVMFMCTLRTNVGLMTVFGSLVILFALLSAGNMAGSPVTLQVAGFEGIFCGASALYLALAEIVNEVYGREILPIGKVETLRAMRNKKYKKKKGGNEKDSSTAVV